MISRKMFRVLLAAACLLCLAQTAFGAGFGLYEMSARGNALGGAMTAKADDPSAVYYNPAGITQLPGLQVQTGVTMIAPNTRITTYDNAGNKVVSKGKSNTWAVPNAYATWQASDRIWLGLGVFSRFGLGTELDENWVGRYNNYDAEIQTVSFNPNIALKLTDKLSLAVGAEIMSFDLALRRKIQTGASIDSDINMTLKGENVSYGYDLALHYKATDWLAVGATYRSKVEQSLRGDASFAKGSATNPLIFNALFKDTAAQGRIVLPESLALGVVVYPMDKLSIEANAIYTAWSSYDNLTIDFTNPVGGASRSATTKNWRDVIRYSLGIEYKALPWLDLRCGYVYDEDPVQDAYADYMVPSNDRHIFSFGPGFHVAGFDIDLSYSYLMIQSRTVPVRTVDKVLASHYSNGDAHMIGLSVGYKF